MSALQWLGLGLVLSPFIAITGVMVRDSGIGTACAVWGMTLATCGVVGGGIALLAAGGP